MVKMTMKIPQMNKRVTVAAVVLFLAISFAAVGGLYARYRSEIDSDKLSVGSKAFYFTSDYLTEINTEYTLSAGTTSIAFELRNYENSVQYSSMDCTYTVSVSTDDPSFNLDQNTYNITGNSMGTKNVVLTGLKNGYTYNVSVTADGGYKKTLSAVFTVKSDNGFFMNVDNSDPHFVLLTVWTENITGNVNITFSDDLIPDGTDPLLNSIKNYQGGQYKGSDFTDVNSFKSAYSSRSYRFFKDKSVTPTFEVKKGSVNATESAIP